MLSSPKNTDLLQATSESATTPTYGTIGKVFNSLQGLQQRLDDFSLEDLSIAIDKTHTLSVRLAALQPRLRAVIEIRKFAAETSNAIEKATAEIRDLSALESSNQPPRFTATGKTRKLTKVSRPSRPAPHTIQEVEKNLASPEIQNNNGNIHATHDPQLVIKAKDDEPPAVPQPANNTGIEKEWSLAPDSSEFESGEEWILESNASTVPEERPFVEFTETAPTPTMTANTGQDHMGDHSDTPAEPNANIEDNSTETFAFTLPKTDRAPASLATKQPPSVPTTPESVDGKALVPAGSDFDQRLLDDLIKDYGEFASSPYVPVPITPKKETTDGQANDKSEGSPLSADDDHSATRHLPSIKKEGEIDRKVKKLIKDYGEYDLYSRQSPVNLKTGIIGAFLLLGVIFAAFYFFSAPKTDDSSQPSSITEPGAISAPTAMGLKKNKNDEAVKTPQSARGASAGLPRTPEANKFSASDSIPFEKNN